MFDLEFIRARAHGRAACGLLRSGGALPVMLGALAWVVSESIVVPHCVAETVSTTSEAAVDPIWTPWTDLDFVHHWGSMPVHGSTSLWLFVEGADAAASDLPVECPNHAWIGMMSGDGAGTADGGFAWDGVGSLNEIVVVPLPASISTTTIEVEHLEYGPITAHLEERWIAGTLTGSTGLSTHVSGLMAIIVIDGAALPDGPSVAVTFAPDRIWAELADAHGDVLAKAGPMLDRNVIDPKTEGAAARQKVIESSRRPSPGSRTESTDCHEALNACEDPCTLAWNESFDGCQSRFDEAIAEADARYRACIDTMAFEDRWRVATSGCPAGAGVGGLIGAWCGGLPGAGLGAAIGSCVALGVGLWESESVLRARCAREHFSATLVAEARRAICVGRAAIVRDRCTTACWREFLTCLEEPEPAGRP